MYNIVVVESLPRKVVTWWGPEQEKTMFMLRKKSKHVNTNIITPHGEKNIRLSLKKSEHFYIFVVWSN